MFSKHKIQMGHLGWHPSPSTISLLFMYFLLYENYYNTYTHEHKANPTNA